MQARICLTITTYTGFVARRLAAGRRSGADSIRACNGEGYFYPSRPPGIYPAWGGLNTLAEKRRALGSQSMIPTTGSSSVNPSDPVQGTFDL
jgi:hypothetical protein